MFSHEREGANINKNGNHAVRSVEVSMTQRVLLRELLSFVKIHDPGIFQLAPESIRDKYERQDFKRRTLKKRVRDFVLADAEVVQIEALYAGVATDTTVMATVQAARRDDPLLPVQLLRDRHAVEGECLQTRKRCYKTISVARRRFDATCMVYYKRAGGNHYGVITKVYVHRPFCHPVTPTFELLKVRCLVCEEGEFLDRVVVPDIVDDVELGEFIFFAQVAYATVCLMPAIGEDISKFKGFTHNAIHIV